MAAYICIDLKSFYASVECVERGLDPLNTNLVVADAGRTEKTICLAVTPALKQYGIPGRARLFEVIETVRRVNAQRLQKLPNHEFTGKSCLASELGQNPSLQLDFIIAPPQMAHYMEISTKIYEIYLRYIAPEDIHVYSIDEVFIDATGYLKTYHCTPQELARKMIREVLQETGITATAGIGTNLYLAKIAMDIVAKKIPADENGVRIAELDEMSYREKLWSHTPLTDFWRIGSGYARRLEKMQIFTMGDLARFSEHGEDLLFRMFGVAAELLIDHAWGYESCTMQAIKSYRPKGHSISQGQVLPCPYDFEKGRLIVREMTELLVLDLVRKKMVADQIVLMVGYDHTGIPETYRGELKKDRYGKKVPKAAHGSVNLGKQTSSTKRIMEKVLSLYDRIVDPDLQVRRMSITANHVIPEGEVQEEVMQYSLFDDVEVQEQKRKQEQESLKKEHQLQEAVLSIKDRYGKNAILKGMNFREGATTMERNEQVGGHKA